ncbi:hypothetical protein SMD44_07289 [Streptomyces alboflavus]|uniref:Uncharacterized protein n=1 Tax=Streptomyces alboflavus TaxID=67267 RepID=A0A1Z1WMX7_9ACTN|nr:hypothetical protein SMD44_07289 [Streptomyces alboflavus]
MVWRALSTLWQRRPARGCSVEPTGAEVVEEVMAIRYRLVGMR